MQIRKNTKKSLAYLSLLGLLAFGQGCATQNISKEKTPIYNSSSFPIQAKETSKLIEDAVEKCGQIFRISQKKDFSEENRDKYTLILNGELGANARKDISLHLLNSVVKGLKGKITSNDELAVIIFNNTDGDEKRARRGKRNNKKIAKRVEKYLEKFNPKFDWRIDMKLVDYNKIRLPDSKEKSGLLNKLFQKNHRIGAHMLHYLLGDDIDSKIAYTGGHGITRHDKFLMFCSSYNPHESIPERDAWLIPFKEYFEWGDNPERPKWLDLTCGSTYPGDKYSIEIEDVIQTYLSTRRCNIGVLNSLKNVEEIDTDKLVRFANNPDYVRNGLEEKLRLRERFFDE